LRVSACFGVLPALLGHWGDLAGFVLDLADLNCTICLRIRFNTLPALPFGKKTEKCLCLGHIVTFEGN
jgi:hypothetical protein